MKNKKFKLTFLGAALCFALVGCSSDDSTETTNNNLESKVLSNDDVTITYGNSLLNHYSESNNSKINLINGYSARSGNSLPTYQNQAVTGAINLVTLANNSNVNTESGKVYFVPTGESFSGSINLVSGAKLIIQGTYSGTLNFNGAAEVYVEGTVSSTNQINVPANGKLVVGPNATFGTQTIIHLNGNGELDNFGVFTYKSNTIDGILNNYKTLVFNGSQNFTVNGNSIINNKCNVTFEKNTQFNGKIFNESKVTFKNGFSINGNGRINVSGGSFTDVINGQLSIDGLVENSSVNTLTNRARINLGSGVTLGNMNANPAFKGGIDINTNLTANQLKIASEVVLNHNTYIANDGCIDVTLGTISCTATSINLNYSGIFASPKINANGVEITLSATDVRVENGKAYVSYHTNDEEFGDAPYGSVRVFDIAGSNPVLIAQADFNKAEFNSLEIHNETLYAVGNNKNGAIMYTVPLVDGMFTNSLDAIKSTNLPSLSAKNIYFNGNDIWLTSSGTNGGLMKLNSDFTLNSIVDNNVGAKYVVANANNQVYLALNNKVPYIRFADETGASRFNPVKTYQSIELNVTDGKNTLALDSDPANKDYVYAAFSDKGVAKFDMTTGELKAQFIPNEFRGLDGYKVLKNNGRSNAVTVDGCFVYIANGGDGVVALNKNTLEYVGHFRLNTTNSTVDQKSANYVYAKNGYLFVASGRNGLAIINAN
ncbi:hypothetical protein [Flavobacterium sp. I3-2]|uniref:hypothetical protein n=1 Tax=Flavobacterium sp. I3-2 TaxID=2748319 RepID=UPI0015AC5F82|nr:hypothetical protein [Flavobacterium sp. I3-2]